VSGEKTPYVLESAIAGDQLAFDALIGPLVDPGFRLAISLLGSRADAEDAIQEATIKAWQNLEKLKDRVSVRSWFLTIVANQCRSLRRTRWWSTVRVADPEKSEQGPEESVVARTDLERALDGLNQEDRAALFLRYYMDLSLEEVARVLGISFTAARSRVHRAVQRLRLELGEADTGR
jgi:RNA polymerase sigma-70 factor (ECF subfamily)